MLPLLPFLTISPRKKWINAHSVHLLGLSAQGLRVLSVPTKKEKQPLSVTHPELAKEADGWDTSEILAGSHKKMLVSFRSFCLL